MRGGFGILTFAALLFALTLRVLVPAGWMPATDGSFAVVPCVAASPPADAHGQHHGGMHKEKRQQHQGNSANDCAFAPLLAGFWLPDAAPPGFEPYLAVNDRPAFHRNRSAPPTGPPAPPPPSTGPPDLA